MDCKQTRLACSGRAGAAGTAKETEAVEQPLTTNAQMIKTQLDTLNALQELDLEIRQRRQQIEGREEQIRQNERDAANLNQALEARKQEIDKLVKDRRDAERTVKERQEQISKLGGQLFEVKTNEAYNTLQAEIKQKKQENSVLEERILEMMVSEDEMHASQDRLAEDLKRQRSRVEEVQQEHRREIAKIESEIAGFRSRWEQIAKELPSALLERYERLRDAKGGMAVSKIENGICTGCRLTIRPQAEIELKKYRSLLVCDNCARILYAE